MKHCLLFLALAACSDSEDKPTITAYVHGRLASMDLDAARMQHDQLVNGTAKSAQDAGDHAHHVLLGAGEPTPERKDELLAIDEWLDMEGPQKIYGDPNFQSAFGALFAQPAAPELYVRHPDWHTWGSLEPPADGKPYWFITVKGHLAQATEADNRKAHDMVAAGFQALAESRGDIAHVPHLSASDPRVFFNVDVSVDHAGALSILQDPAFQQNFGALFDAPPEVHVYASTNWRQW